MNVGAKLISNRLIECGSSRIQININVHNLGAKKIRNEWMKKHDEKRNMPCQQCRGSGFAKFWEAGSAS
jgi:hypothetical protein